jgi:hypothetical protein
MGNCGYSTANGPHAIALERNYQGYSTLLDVLLGTNHRVSFHFRSFIEAFRTLKVEVEEQFGEEIHAALPLFQHHTQLTKAQYFNDAVVQGANARLLRIQDLIDIIKYHQWSQLPQLPPRYTHTLGPSGTPGSGNQLGNRSASGTTAQSGTSSNGTRYVNVAPNSVLMARFERLRDLTRNEALIPRGNNTFEALCLSHILRGECNTSCRRAGTHRALIQMEKFRVGEFLTQMSVE